MKKNLLLLTLFLLTSCCRIEVNYKINYKGVPKANASILVLEESLTQQNIEIDNYITNLKENNKIQSVEKIYQTINGKEYVGMDIIIEQESVSVNTNRYFNKLEMTIENPKHIFDFNSDILKIRDSEQFLKSIINEAKLEIKMPGNIIKASEGEIKGNKLILNIFDSQDDIEIVSYTYSPIVVLLLLSIIAIVLVQLIIKLKKKMK